MVPKFLNRVHSGQRANVAADWNALIDAINRCRILISEGCGLAAEFTPHGALLRIAARNDRYLAIASGAINKRVGTTPGTGNVKMVTYNGTSLVTDTVLIPVINPSSNAMTSTNGIDSGQYCWIEQDPSGWWIVTPLECS